MSVPKHYPPKLNYISRMEVEGLTTQSNISSPDFAAAKAEISRASSSLPNRGSSFLNHIPIEFKPMVDNMFSPFPLEMLCKIFVQIWMDPVRPKSNEALYDLAFVAIVSGALRSDDKRAPYHATPIDFANWMAKSKLTRRAPWIATLINEFDSERNRRFSAKLASKAPVKMPSADEITLEEATEMYNEPDVRPLSPSKDAFRKKLFDACEKGDIESRKIGRNRYLHVVSLHSYFYKLGKKYLCHEDEQTKESRSTRKRK